MPDIYLKDTQPDNGREVRPEFKLMLDEHGCPECKSVDTYETIVSTTVGGKNKDNVPACICDECGHVEVKYSEDE